MPTIPTGKLERELRRLYQRWVHQLPKHQRDLHKYVAKFQRESIDLIERMGGDIARLGVYLADFPAPKRLDLSLHVGTIYSDMELAAISAQIETGLSPKTTARELVRAGVDKSYRRLERLARTETVRAYWKNAWDSIDGLPGLVMVWGAEDGPRTCDWCKKRDGMVIDSPDFRDHPNGRCTPIPTLRSQLKYNGSVDADGRLYWDFSWPEESFYKPATVSEPTAVRKPQPEYNPISEEEALSMSKRFEDLYYDEQDAVEFYQSGGYADINEALRGGNLDKRAAYAQVSSHLDYAMTPFDRGVNVYRGQGWRSMLNSLGIDSNNPVPEEWDIKSKIGTQLRQPGFYSTSISERRARGFLKDNGFMIDVMVPPGVKAHYVHTGSEGFDYEQELLLQRGLDFVLTKADLVADPRGIDKQIWRITLRAVPK